MLVVVVDTSTPAVTAALALVDPHAVGDKGFEVLAERRTINPRAHVELLAPAITQVLAEVGASARDLAALVAGLGPGPFTGLRAGVVTAAAMGQALTIPTYGVCSLDAMGLHTAVPTVVATDARRKEVYWALYRNGARVTGPSVDKPAAVATTGVAQAVGDGALRYADVLGLPVLDEPRYPPADGLVALAADRIRRRAAGEVLTPLYLRRPDVPDAAEPGVPQAVVP